MLVYTSYPLRANWWKDCDAQQSTNAGDGTVKRKLVDPADGLQSSWEVSGLLFRPVCFAEAESRKNSRQFWRTSKISARESRSTPDFMWRLTSTRSFHGLTKSSRCWRGNTEAEHIEGHKRFLAGASTAHCRGRTGPDGDEHADGRKLRTRVGTRKSWTEPMDAQKQMDFIMVSRSLAAKKIQVLDFDWFKSDHRAVFAVLALRSRLRHSVVRSGVNLRGWMEVERHLAKSCFRDVDKLKKLGCVDAAAHGNCNGTQRGGDKSTDSDRIGAQNPSVAKEERRTIPRARMPRLCRAIWRTRRALKREKHLTKIKESAPKKTQRKHFDWSSIAKQEKSLEVSRQLLPRPLLTPCRLCGACPSPEDSLVGLVEESQSGLCCWNADFNKEIGESAEQAETWERIARRDHSRRFERTAAGLCGESGESVVGDVLGHEIFGEIDVFHDNDGTKSCGCHEPGHIQADRWIVCDERSTPVGRKLSLNCLWAGRNNN